MNKGTVIALASRVVSQHVLTDRLRQGARQCCAMDTVRYGRWRKPHA